MFVLHPDTILDELMQNVEAARNHMDMANTIDDLDTAIYELKAAEIILNKYIKDKKGGTVLG
jgi:uncharacterized protein YigA (DUF484 family)